MSSFMFEGSPLRPRRSGPLRVLIVARISTEHQDARSLDDQVALCKEYVLTRYPHPVEFEIIQGRGSGEYLDREDLHRAEAAAECGDYDLIVGEDLGRICRRSRAMSFCESCEDSDTRFIALNDCIDTADENWRMNALFASFKHESGNKDTAKRIRRTLRNRFTQGGVVQTIQFGYVKGVGSAEDADLRKLPEAEAVYETIFTMLEGDASFSEVGDWMNQTGVPMGKWNRNTVWDCRMVGRLVQNPIIKGLRRRNEVVSKRVNKSGKRKAVKAPASERLSREVPHLAFIEPARFDRLMAKLTAKNGHYARGRRTGEPDCRAGVSRKRTVWPGQHATCGVCGRLMYWGGHGRTKHMMCSGSRDYACWNGSTFEGTTGAKRIAAAVLKAVESLPDFDAAFKAKVEAEANAASETGRRDEKRLRGELAEAEREKTNFVTAIGKMGFSDALEAKLTEVEARHARITAELAGLQRRVEGPIELPSVEVLKEKCRSALGEADFSDPAFGRLMNRLLPKIALFPCRLIDGEAVELRAKVTINLLPLVEASRPDLDGVLTAEMTVDLFDPPQREAYRLRIADELAAGYTQIDAAKKYGLTITAASRAMILHRRMKERNLTDAYEYLTGPLDGRRKNSRHKHPRYDFRPLSGYPIDPTAPLGARFDD